MANGCEYLAHQTLMPLFKKTSCVLATSAPVERIFSHGERILRRHRACLGDKMLSGLVCLKCNVTTSENDIAYCVILY